MIGCFDARINVGLFRIILTPSIYDSQIITLEFLNVWKGTLIL